MIDITILKAMAAAGATVEVVLAAIEAAQRIHHLPFPQLEKPSSSPPVLLEQTWDQPPLIEAPPKERGWPKRTPRQSEIEKLATQLAGHLEELRKCESPIESQLGVELVAQCPFDDGYRIVSQQSFRNFRMDFAIFDKRTPDKTTLFIECDGKDYHNTPGQIENDQRKNKAAADAGVLLMRFTGSQIFHDAESCARMVWATAADLRGKIEAPA